MSGVNQITIVGNVGTALELSYGQNNVPYCRFSVAVNEQWKAEGEKRERVTWFPVVAFNGLAESCANFLDRGCLLAVQGRVQNREYEDREGVRRQVMQVVADRVTFLGAAKRDEENERRPSPGKPRADNHQAAVSDGDVPSETRFLASVQFDAPLRYRSALSGFCCCSARIV